MDDPTPFGTALHDRVRDEHPDLDRLVRVSVSTGTRLRRRRHVGTALVAITGVAAIALGTALLDGSDAGSRTDPGVAGDPSVGRPSETVDEGTLRQTLEQLSREVQARARARQVLEAGAPVYVASADWRCDKPLDEKFICSRGDASVVVNWRPAASWADYQDPSKAGQQTFVSEVHDAFFATVSPGSDTTKAQVEEVAVALIWADDPSGGAPQ